jgi:glycine/D-amino acid oxidase-like deaminating enzyme
LNAEGMTAYRELERELGSDAGHHESGLLEWANEVGEHQLRERVARLASRGYSAEFISRARALAMEPGLAIPERVRDVAFYAADAWLDAPRLIRTLLDAATAKRAEIRTNTPVRSFRIAGHHVDAVVIDSGEALEWDVGTRCDTIAGLIPGFANAWMIATHSGVTLGALLGRLIADEIVRDMPSPMLAPFRPGRFTTSSASA